MSHREDDAAAKAADGRKPSSIPAPATVPRPSRPPGERASAPPPAPGAAGQRKAATQPAASPGQYAAYAEDDFDAERTMVVDPDDAPTADYDPRNASYAAFAQPGRPAFVDGQPAEDQAIPPPRGSRRTSRRTVKIPEDPVKRKDRVAAVTIEEPPTSRGDDESNATPVDGTELPPDSIRDEITIVKPLRIIDIGAEPPPPIRSAFATWPPAAYDESSLEGGWTPAAPLVMPAIEADAEPAPVTEEEPPTPLAPPVVPAAARPPLTSAPEIRITSQSAGEALADLPDLSEVEAELDSRDDVLEEIEPDAAPIAPKRPPPPPPKTKADAPAAKPEPEKEKRPKTWYEDIFEGEYIRTHDRPDARLVKREVDFIEESLGVEKHAVVLDLACGMGDQALELSSRGYSVVGLDLSQGMLDIANRGIKRRQSGDPGFNAPTFTQGDMREMSYDEAFDGVYCWSTSFGYFDDEKNLAVLKNVHRALRQGGMFLLDVINRDYVAPRSPSLVWFEGTQCVCMDDMFVDFLTSRMRVKRTAMFEGGLSRELDYSIRLYSLSELGRMLKEVGFKVVEITGHTAHPGVFFGTESPRLIVLAERS
jgi:ubiquinone/menaquinone biosynthesis C-methylase UbiE